MDNKNQRNSSRKNNNSKGRNKKRSGSRFIFAIIIVTLITILVCLVVRMFGKVNISSSDIGDFSQDVISLVPTNENTTGSQPKKTMNDSATTHSSVVTSSGHYLQSKDVPWNLKLANPWNPVDKNYSQPLVTYSGVNKFDSRAIDKLREIVKDGSAYIRVASLYRSIEKQTKLYEDEVRSVMSKQGKSREDAEKIAVKAVAKPGTSEHNLGLAVDFLFEGYSSLTTSYENTQAYKWMIENCANYGFILRYPKGKENLTGYMFEPWHYRYVGKEVAHEIMSRKITLEEYLQEKGI